MFRAYLPSLDDRILKVRLKAVSDDNKLVSELKTGKKEAETTEGVSGKQAPLQLLV